MSNLSIKILESDGVIIKRIHTSLAKIFNKSLRNNANKIKANLKPIIASALSASPELNSLSSGGLRIDFGLTSDPSSAIVSTVVDSLDIDIQKAVATASGIKGGLLITMQPSDYSNLFSLSVAEQIIAGGSIPWLKWLLTFGQQIIIGNYGVEYRAGTGRTGGGHMIIAERPFKVNSSYAGTADNNFITRSVRRVAPQVKNTIIKAIQ